MKIIASDLAADYPPPRHHVTLGGDDHKYRELLTYLLENEICEQRLVWEEIRYLNAMMVLREYRTEWDLTLFVQKTGLSYDELVMLSLVFNLTIEPMIVP